MRTIVFSAVACVCLSALACSNDQPSTQPTPPLVTEAGVPQPASPPRTVGHRNPFGDVLQADNLVADGDFELTGRYDQAPWVAFDSNGQSTLNYDTGGHCRSGIRCAVVAKNEQIVGYMASPAQGDFEVRAYIKPDSTHCSDARVIVIDFANQGAGGTTILPTTSGADENGWCLYMAPATNLAYQQPMIYIDVSSSSKSESVIVDQVSVLPVDEAPAHKAAIPKAAPPPDALKRAAFITDWLRKHRIVGQRRAPIVP